MKDNIVILHAERVEFPARGADGQPTGELVQFTRIQYLSDEAQDDSRYKGYGVSEGIAPIELFGSLELLPGLYETDFRKTTVVDRNGRRKVGLEPVGAKLIGDPGLSFDANANGRQRAS